MTTIGFDQEKKVLITSEALEKIYSYAYAVDTEIGGILLVEKTDGHPIIKDALLFKQRATKGDVELDLTNLSKELSKMKKEDVEKLKGWWHSHNDMDAFWSGTDDECFANLLNLSSVVYGIVINKQGKLKLRADFKTELGTLRVDNIKLLPVVNINNKYVLEARAKVNSKNKSIVKKAYAIIKNIFAGGDEEDGLQTAKWDIQPTEYE